MPKQSRMWTYLFFFAAVQPALWAPVPVWAGTPGPTGAGVVKDAQALTEAIDQHMAARWAAEGVKPADRADDAEFMRRVYLDLAGKIPPVSEVRDFLADKTPDKRGQLVEKLLDSSAYVNHFTNVWRARLLPANNTNFGGSRPDLEAWLRRQLLDNASYDQMVRDILTAGTGMQPAGATEPTPLAFFQANENKPENLAASTSRLFLGIKLECAQCHDHKFTDLSREQFWGMAAFFNGATPQAGSSGRQIQIPNTPKMVRARFLDGTEPRWQEGDNPRVVLANWVATRENRYFARAGANWLWAQFFGTGLVHPYDDMIAEHTPSHPRLLDELAQQFARNDFDVKYMIRAITASRAYNLSSMAAQGSGKENPQLFARMSVRGLTPEQLFASLAQATGYRDSLRQGQLAGFGVNSREEFLAKFANASDNPTEVQTSILQALAIMNGKFMDDVTSLERSEMLAAVTDGPFRDDAQRIEALYLATLSRKPRPQETDRLVRYVAGGGPAHDSKKALGDVFWALLNSGEFVTIH